MADDTLTDDELDAIAQRALIACYNHGAYDEVSQLVKSLRAARTRLAELEAENEKLRADIAAAETRGRQEFAAYLLRVADATRSRLGVDGD